MNEKEISDSIDFLEPTTDEMVDILINALKSCPEKRAQKVFKMRYLEAGARKTQKFASIAQKMGVSSQTVINIHNRGVKFLKKKLTEQGI